ncbi:MAG: hypothetical protein ACQEQA_02540 [Bacillota bacterium]
MFHKHHMTTGAWLLFFFLMAIPMVNIVVIILILLDRTYNPSLRNFIKAYIVLIIIGLFVLFGLWSFIAEILRQALEENDQVTIALTQYLY